MAARQEIEASPGAVLAFWRAAGREKWFGGGAAFDAEVRAALGLAYEAAAAGRLDGWQESPEGALALVILLDQAPRNIHRGTPRAFATDARALCVAEAALARDFDRAEAAAGLQDFFYLPFMHQEDAGAQRRCVALFEALGEPESLRYAKIHLDVIERFGRFPHRNPILGRAMRADEQAYLDAGGFSG